VISSEVAMPGSYNYGLVALSVVIGVFASYCVLDLAGRVTSARGWIRSAWLAGGAIALGFGIWAEHFTGMLSFSLPVPVSYNLPIVLASLLIAVLASAIALYVLSRQKMEPAQLLTGGVLIGGGITALHYTAMAAMRSSAACRFNLILVALSAVLAILFSTAALWLAFHFRNDAVGTVLQRTVSAIVLGAAVSAMHYTGMAATSFVTSTLTPDLSHAVSVSSLGIAGIAIVTLIVLGMAVLTSFVDRRFAAKSFLLQQSDQHKQQAQALIDAIPHQIWSGSGDGTIDFCNERWRSYMGGELEKLGGLQSEGWQSMLHPDDRERSAIAWRDSATNGTPYEQEERHRGADGQYRWFLARGVPLRDADGRIVRWYGTNTDIDDLKHAEERLRQISGLLLRYQDEERRSIARDLHDSTGQNLVVLAASLAQLQAAIPSTNRKARKLLSESQALADQCMREVRTLSYLLHPPMLDEAGLEDAIRLYVEGFAKRSGIHVELQMSPEFGRVDRDVELTLFRVVQEGLTNIQRHSGSLRADIRINRTPEKITLEVSDNGSGIFRNQQTGNGETPIKLGVGIASIRERVNMIGGQLHIASSTSGTTLRVTIPLNE
jgi:PAS domain S-box-containing protein